MFWSKKVRYAVVGSGWFAQQAVLPAFANAGENSTLAAIVSGDAEKRDELGGQYGVPAVPYEGYDKLLEGGDVDAVYIVLPNSQHCDYTLRAAARGVHVLCEKPLAGSAAECRRMIDACAATGVKLMTAYRLHFEPANLEAVEIVQGGRLGEPRLFSSVHATPVEAGNTRLEGDLAGGPLRDIGIYCINAARYLFRDEPTEVLAATASRAGDARFAEVPEMVSAVLRFPRDRLATFSCSFGGAKVSEYRVVGTRGDLHLDPAYSFNEPLRRTLTVDRDAEEKEFARGDHVGPEIVYFSRCVLEDRDVEPDGWEGLADLLIIEAIEQAARTGRAAAVERVQRPKRPGKGQQIDRPDVGKPGLVNAAPPSG